MYFERPVSSTILLILAAVAILVVFFLPGTPWIRVHDTGELPGEALTGYQIAFKATRLQTALGMRILPWLIAIPVLTLALVGWRFLATELFGDTALVPAIEIALALSGAGLSVLCLVILPSKATGSFAADVGLILTWVAFGLIVAIAILELIVPELFDTLDDLLAGVFESQHAPAALAVLGIATLLALVVVLTWFLTRQTCEDSTTTVSICPDPCPAAVLAAQSQLSGMTARLEGYQERATRVNELLVPTMEKVRPVSDFVDSLKGKSIMGISVWDGLTEVLDLIFPGQGIATALRALESTSATLGATQEAARVFASTDPLVEALEGFESQPTCLTLWGVSQQITDMQGDLYLAREAIERTADEIVPLKDGQAKVLVALASCDASNVFCQAAAGLAGLLEDVSEPITSLLGDFEILSQESQQDLDRLERVQMIIYTAAGESLLCHSGQ